MANKQPDLFGNEPQANVATLRQIDRMRKSLVEAGITVDLIVHMQCSGFLRYLPNHYLFGDPDARCVLVQVGAGAAHVMPTHSSRTPAGAYPTLHGESRCVWIAEDPLPALRRISAMRAQRRPTLILCGYDAGMNAATAEALRTARSIVAWLRENTAHPAVAAAMWRTQIEAACAGHGIDIQVRVEGPGDGMAVEPQPRW